MARVSALIEAQTVPHILGQAPAMTSERWFNVIAVRCNFTDGLGVVGCPA